MRVAVLPVLLLLAGSAVGSERLAGPIPAELLRVIDGDTMMVSARIWPGQSVETSVRLLGIDAPELRSKCPEERERARAARDWLRRAAPEGGRLLLRDVHFDKYGGRMLARVESGGEDLGRALLKEGLARRYEGGQRAGWC